MIRRPPKSTRTDTLVPYTTLFIAHIASFRLKVSCDFHIHAVMAINIRDIFDEIGGAAKVARLMNAPVTTVWAWKKSNRITPARLAHLRLALKANRITCRTLEAGGGQNGPAMAARQVARKASAKRRGAV